MQRFRGTHACAGTAIGAHDEHVPGEPGVWILILGEMTVFAVLFGAFIHYRSLDTALYARSQRALNPDLGVLNTLLLLTSSWFVALGVDATRRSRTGAAPSLFALALLCGLGFVLIKAVEYHALIGAGYTAGRNEFFTFYFVLTGLHLLHVLLGIVLLAVLRVAARGIPGEAVSMGLIEGGGCYWHMVDLLWIVLYPLLYLIK